MSKKAKLKWRRLGGQSLYAGPFKLIPQHKPDEGWYFVYIRNPINGIFTILGGDELERCKESCEAFASSILEAVKP